MHYALRMGKTFDGITAEMTEWVRRQPVFFVATSPLASDGHVNCSPKGGDTFRVLSEREVAYLDLTGSGVETIAHLQENGRIVVMFCAFAGPPKIVRFHGTGTVVFPDEADYASLAARFSPQVGARAIIRITVSRVSDSCGFAVPRMDWVGARDALDKWADTKGPEGLVEYRRRKNRQSIDGLAGVPEVHV